MGQPQLFDLDDEGNPVDPKGVTNEEPAVTEDNIEAQPVVAEEPQPQETEIPEKYQGKSVADLVKMHQEVEKALGRQSGEVGELRKIVDQHIQSQTVASGQEQLSEPMEELDFYEDPNAAVRKAVETHPAIQEAQAVSQEFRKGATLAALQQKHPDMQTIVHDPAFATWLQSKKALADMFVRADQQYDLEAADALFTLWKERSSVVQQTVEVEKAARTQQAKAAQTGNVSSAPEGTRSKKIYRRSEVIKLMNADPDRYQAMQDEIMQAYAEGRVK